MMADSRIFSRTFTRPRTSRNLGLWVYGMNIAWCANRYNVIGVNADFPSKIDDMVAQAIKSSGGFVWACKNYDGDVQVTYTQHPEDIA